MLAASFDTFLGTCHLALDFSAQEGRTVLPGESSAGKTAGLAVGVPLEVDEPPQAERSRHTTIENRKRYTLLCSFLCV